MLPWAGCRVQACRDIYRGSAAATLDGEDETDG
jgi:hypothetical protein